MSLQEQEHCIMVLLKDTLQRDIVLLKDTLQSWITNKLVIVAIPFFDICRYRRKPSIKCPSVRKTG
jgi:hypothetical protein